MTKIHLIKKDCIICGSRNHEQIYSSKQPAGSILGNLTVKLHVCNVCGFVWQNPQPCKKSLADYYANDINASGSVFHATHLNSQHSIKQNNRIAFFQPLLSSISSHGLLVEVGCSTGEFLSALDLPGWTKLGIEPSPTASSIAKSSGIKIINQCIDDIRLDKSVFDAVAAFSVLEHLSELPAAISNISHSLKPGGLLLFEIPDSLKAEPQLAEFFGYEHLWHFTIHTIGKFLSNYGLVLTHLDNSVVDARIRAVAVKDNNFCDSKVISSLSSPSLKIVIEKYQDKRSALISAIEKKITRFLGGLADGQNFAIYGAGIHTLHLLEHFTFLRATSSLIDSNPKRWGEKVAGYRVISIDEAVEPHRKIKKIIISSKAFEDEIYESLSNHPDSRHFEILRLYS